MSWLKRARRPYKSWWIGRSTLVPTLFTASFTIRIGTNWCLYYRFWCVWKAIKETFEVEKKKLKWKKREYIVYLAGNILLRSEIKYKAFLVKKKKILCRLILSSCKPSKLTYIYITIFSEDLTCKMPKCFNELIRLRIHFIRTYWNLLLL